MTENRAEPEGEVHRDRFARHVSWLSERFEMVTLGDGLDRLLGQRDGRDLLALTFDDGYRNNVETAWPVLRAQGVPATFFLTCGFVDGGPLWFEVALRALSVARSELPGDGRDSAQLFDSLFGSAWRSLRNHQVIDKMKRLDEQDFLGAVERLQELRIGAGWETPRSAQPMSWQDARRLVAEGAEIGAHTVTHPILSMLPESAQRREIFDSKRRIESEIGTSCSAFAYPNGSRHDFDERTIALVTAAGFKNACTTIRGTNRAADDPMTLRRIGIGPDPLYLLDARLAGLFDDGMRQRLAGWLGS